MEGLLTWLKIFDASGSWPTDAKACYDDGFRVVAGYRGSSSWKEFTPAMRDKWRGARFGVAAMFESTAGRALSGYSAGVADGKAARAAWRAIGMPDSDFIAYAVDVNVNESQIEGVVADYFRGVKVGDTGADPWAYIENDGIKWLFAHDLIDGGFQPAAWGWGNPASPDAWDPHAFWRQEHNGVSLHGGDVDTGHILSTANFWRAPGDTTGDEYMPLNSTDIHNVWHASELADEAGKSEAVSPANGVEKARNAAEAAQAGVKALTAKVDALATKVAAIPTTSVPAAPIDYTALADALKPVIDAEVAKIRLAVG